MEVSNKATYFESGVGKATAWISFEMGCSAAKAALSQLEKFEPVSIQGTNLAEAIHTASRMFDKETKKYKILLF